MLGTTADKATKAWETKLTGDKASKENEEKTVIAKTTTTKNSAIFSNKVQSSKVSTPKRSDVSKPGVSFGASSTSLKLTEDTHRDKPSKIPNKQDGSVATLPPRNERINHETHDNKPKDSESKNKIQSVKTKGSDPNYRDVVLNFYKEHRPSKLGEVDKLLLKYKV